MVQKFSFSLGCVRASDVYNCFSVLLSLFALSFFTYLQQRWGLLLVGEWNSLWNIPLPVPLPHLHLARHAMQPQHEPHFALPCAAFLTNTSQEGRCVITHYFITRLLLNTDGQMGPIKCFLGCVWLPIVSWYQTICFISPGSTQKPEFVSLTVC